MGEGTLTGTAIRMATQVFHSARSNVRKVAIVITDGQTDRRDPVKLDIAVREAQAANVEMYALGIVNVSDPTQKEFLSELYLIASDPDSEHMYPIDDFNTLPGKHSTCQTKQTFHQLQVKVLSGVIISQGLTIDLGFDNSICCPVENMQCV